MSSPRERETRISIPHDPNEDCGSYVFNIPPKNASIERLRRWRKATFALNATRRFRYTLNLKREEREKLLRRIRTHSQVVRATILFQEGAVNEGTDKCSYLIKEVANSTRRHTCANFEERVQDLSFPYGWK